MVDPEAMPVRHGARIFEDHRRALFGDHRRRCIGIARRDRRHHRGIDDAQSGDAVKPQPFVDDGQRIAGRAHLRGADGMKDRGADVAGGFRQRGVVVADRRPRQIFLRAIPRQRRLLHQPPRDADGVGGDLAVFAGRQIVRRDHRRLVGCGRANPHGAARGRPQVAGADGDRGKAMQGIAELVERQRLHVELDVGALAGRVRAGEDAELRRRHGQGPAAAERIVEAHQSAPDQRVIGLVQRAHAARPDRSRAAADDPAGCARRPGGRARFRCRAAPASPLGRCRSGAAPGSIRSSRRTG